MPINVNPINAGPINAEGAGFSDIDSDHVASMGIYPASDHIAVCPFWRENSDHVASMLFKVDGEADHVASLYFPLASDHLAPMGILAHLAGDHIAPLPIRASLASDHLAPMRLLLPVDADHAAPMPIGETPWAQADHVAPMPLWAYFGGVDETTQTIVTRVSDGLVLHAAELEIALSEDDVHWSASVVLAEPIKALSLEIGDLIDVTAGAKTWRLLIEDIEYDRPGFGLADAKIRAVSPTASLDAPMAIAMSYTLTQAKAASDIAAELADGFSLSWDRADWIVKPYRVSLSDNTPLAALGWIADETRGILYAAEDGQTLHLRDQFPVTVTAMAGASPHLILSERDDILLSGESDTLAVVINRVRVHDSETSESIQIEHEVEGLEARTRAYPTPWRSLSFRTTRGDLVTLSEPAEETRMSENEIVEIEAGAGLAKYPILVLQSAIYLSDNLGAVTVAPYSREIRTAQSDYSLLQISYTTRAWLVEEIAGAEGAAQFVVEE